MRKKMVHKSRSEPIMSEREQQAACTLAAAGGSCLNPFSKELVIEES